MVTGNMLNGYIFGIFHISKHITAVIPYKVVGFVESKNGLVV